MRTSKNWRSGFRYVNYQLFLRSPRWKKAGACVKKVVWFRRDFHWFLDQIRLKNWQKNGKSLKNQKNPKIAALGDPIFGQDADFGRFLRFPRTQKWPWRSSFKEGLWTFLDTFWWKSALRPIFAIFSKFPPIRGQIFTILDQKLKENWLIPPCHYNFGTIFLFNAIE